MNEWFVCLFVCLFNITAGHILRLLADRPLLREPSHKQLKLRSEPLSWALQNSGLITALSMDPLYLRLFFYPHHTYIRSVGVASDKYRQVTWFNSNSGALLVKRITLRIGSNHRGSQAQSHQKIETIPGINFSAYNIVAG